MNATYCPYYNTHTLYTPLISSKIQNASIVGSVSVLRCLHGSPSSLCLNIAPCRPERGWHSLCGEEVDGIHHASLMASKLNESKLCAQKSIAGASEHVKMTQYVVI